MDVLNQTEKSVAAAVADMSGAKTSGQRRIIMVAFTLTMFYIVWGIVKVVS